MSTCNGEVEHAIELLRSLIEKSPGQASYRMRLLMLLHANHLRYEFVVEAHRYKANCDLTFDTNWTQICEMGREIDPGNEFFGRGKRSTNHLHPQSGNEYAAAGPPSMPKPEHHGNGAHPPADLPGETGLPGVADQSDFVKQRAEDRQKYYSSWLGEERRKFQEEQKPNQPVDSGRPRKG